MRTSAILVLLVIECAIVFGQFPQGPNFGQGGPNFGGGPQGGPNFGAGGPQGGPNFGAGGPQGGPNFGAGGPPLGPNFGAGQQGPGGQGGFGPQQGNAGIGQGGQTQQGLPPPPPSNNPWTYATCYFNETGSNVRGRVDMRQSTFGGPTQVRVQVIGLPPSLMSDTEHGMHVHEYGDVGRGCYGAGPHFDVNAFSFHGSPNNVGVNNFHEGDMGNLRQSNAGVIDAELSLPAMAIDGDNGVIGRAVVLHEGRDDLGRGGTSMSLQTGNAGAPIACCVLAHSDNTNWDNRFIETGRPSQFSNTVPTNANQFGGFQGQAGFNPGFNGANPFGPGPGPNGFNGGVPPQGGGFGGPQPGGPGGLPGGPQPGGPGGFGFNKK